MLYVYVLRGAKNGKVYIGRTSKKPTTRLKEHNQGSNKWTRENGPFELIYYESYFCQKDANNRELFLKSGQGRRLIKLICQYY